MEKFNKNNYDNFEQHACDVIDAFMSTGQPIYVVAQVSTAMLMDDFSIPEDQKESLRTAVIALLVDICVQHYKQCGESNIKWSDLAGIRRFIWKSAIQCAIDEKSFDETVACVNNSIANRKNVDKYASWLGMYIYQVVNNVYEIRPEDELSFVAYAFLEDGEVYRGKIQGSNAWWYSHNPEGIVDNNDHIGSYFIPETVCRFSERYDDTHWDELTEDEQLEFIDNIAVPIMRYDLLPDIYRGKPIFDKDVAEALVYDDDGNILSRHPFVVIMNKEDIEIIDIDPVNEIPKNKQVSLVVIGNIFDNPEYQDAYEQALTSLLMNNK